MRAPLLRSASERPKTSATGAFLEGWRRAAVAPALTAGAWLLTLALTTPLALVVGGLVEQQVGSGVTAEGRARRWAPGWATDLSAAATEPGRTFAYELVGFGGTVATLSRVFD